MSNVFTFPGKKPAAESAPAQQESIDVPETDNVAEMVQQSAVMQLVSTLAFYAKGGFDHGTKAGAAVPALREILASRGIALVFQQQPS